jgi:glucosamine-phosphate N-acetyltransferase
MKIRKLNKDDYDQYLLLINDFKKTYFSKIIFKELLDIINSNSTIWVIEEDGKLIGTGTILYEYKFIRDISKCAHIEDICINKDYRGKNYGTLLIDHLINEAQNNNCYKVILDCNSELEKFYAKSGLIKSGIQMALYF